MYPSRVDNENGRDVLQLSKGDIRTCRDRDNERRTSYRTTDIVTGGSSIRPSAVNVRKAAVLQSIKRNESARATACVLLTTFRRFMAWSKWKLTVRSRKSRIRAISADVFPRLAQVNTSR